MHPKLKFSTYIKHDFSSGLVVFLVALPLCLGIALASGAPLFSGIVSGIIGGIVVGILSNSPISVSGPAAGLAAIIVASIKDLGSFEVFLVAVVMAGIFQLILGFLKAGSISNYFPNNVIEGMLAGIGILIFYKQIPHALGYDKVPEGDTSFIEKDGSTLFDTILVSLEQIHFGAVLVATGSLLILFFWQKIPKIGKIKLVPPALVAVTFGIVLNEIFQVIQSPLAIQQEHLVNLPVITWDTKLEEVIMFPNFSWEIFTQSKIYIIAITIAVVASIETLLCIEAADKMDEHKRFTNTNLELKAQGVGNILSGLLGGLPMTSVIVRSSANANARAQTKMSTIIHGVLMLVSVLALASILNKIPNASLAAILLLIGYRLARPSLFKHFLQKGKFQYLPFLATVLAVVFLDLLKGVGLGMLISVVFILIGNFQRAYSFRKEEYHDGDVIHIDLAQEVSFLNKAAIKNTLNNIPENSKVIINASDTVYIDQDVLDLIKDFKNIVSKELNIDLKLNGFKKAYQLEDHQDDVNHVTIQPNQ